MKVKIKDIKLKKFLFLEFFVNRFREIMLYYIPTKKKNGELYEKTR